MSDETDTEDTTGATPEPSDPKLRKLKLTKRVIRHFHVRSGLQGGQETADYTAYIEGYRDSGTGYVTRYFAGSG